jgi:hypothetical protein
MQSTSYGSHLPSNPARGQRARRGTGKMRQRDQLVYQPADARPQTHFGHVDYFAGKSPRVEAAQRRASFCVSDVACAC